MSNPRGSYSVRQGGPDSQARKRFLASSFEQVADKGGMPGASQGTENLYRIKLYGHMGTDDGVFADKLSAVLGVHEWAAHLLLQSVPIVVREGLDETQANRLREVLSSIGALCLMEPMDPEAAERASAMEQAIPAPSWEVTEDSETKDKRFPVVWISIALGAVGGLILMFAAASIWSSYTRMSGNFGPAPGESRHQHVSPVPQDQLQKDARTLSELYAETDEVQRNLERLKFIADLKQRDMRAVSGGYRVDRNVVRERTIEWERAREEVAVEAKKLKQLEAAIKIAEGKLSP